MKTISKSIATGTAALLLTGFMAGIAMAQPSGTPRTDNRVPTDCARLTTQGAKDECARGYNQKTTPGSTQDTGVGKGQGQGQGVGQGSGQGAIQGTGRDKK